MQLLIFLKERKPGGAMSIKPKTQGTIPVAEEKQILDALKIVLENGYTVGQIEIVQIFDLIGLNGAVEGLEQNQSFMEFLRKLAELF